MQPQAIVLKKTTRGSQAVTSLALVLTVLAGFIASAGHRGIANHTDYAASRFFSDDLYAANDDLFLTLPLNLPSASTATGFADPAGHSPTANSAPLSAINAPGEGYGGPILLITNASYRSNPFGRYYAEILRSEGLNLFDVRDIATVGAATLNDYDVVILSETPLTSEQAQMFRAWVMAGGNLIAMRPDPQLADLLGLSEADGTLTDAYLHIHPSGPGAGLVTETVQFHGTADCYTLSGAIAVATLYADATTPTPYPAVTLHNVGGNGGQAVAFTYDLARSVVYTRQGNPVWAGDERDGREPLRSNDMFYGAKVGGLQRDWIDLNKVAIPQADEQQRLLTNLILFLNRDRKPLPRFWYFPNGHKAVVIMTGDDHGTTGTAIRFEIEKSLSPPGCSVANWECVRSTAYIYSTNSLSDTLAAAYHAEGFEIALHVNTNCANWTPAQLDWFFATQLAVWRARYPSLPPPVTERTHCIAWSDWVSHARVGLTHGIRLDTNYYFWPPEWVNDRPGMFTGSGMPMRFADLDGTIIDVYQATTQMTDESGQSYPYTIDTLLDRALGPEGYYGAFVANMHNDFPDHAGHRAIVASAQARGVPVISSRQMLEWLDGRNSSFFGDLTWSESALHFTIVVGAGASGLMAMLPTQSGVGHLSRITRAGSPVDYTLQTIKGVEYAMFLAQPGEYVADYTPDTAVPVISGCRGASAGARSERLLFANTPLPDMALGVPHRFRIE